MILNLLKLLLSAQFLKFLYVGITAAAVNWISRYAFDQFTSFSMSVICAYVVGMTVAFTLNTIYVFPESKRARHLQARDFFAINVAFMPLVWTASLGLNFLFLRFNMPQPYSESLAHGMALGVPMILSFLFYKIVAFRDAGQA